MDIENVNFGMALEALKNGSAISRKGWNGKGMLLFLNKGSLDFKLKPISIEGIRGDLFEKGADGTVTRLPNINMRTATGSTVTGWIASQTDMLAEDWCILGEEEVKY